MALSSYSTIFVSCVNMCPSPVYSEGCVTCYMQQCLRPQELCGDHSLHEQSPNSSNTSSSIDLFALLLLLGPVLASSARWPTSCSARDL